MELPTYFWSPLGRAETSYDRKSKGHVDLKTAESNIKTTNPISSTNSRFHDIVCSFHVRRQRYLLWRHNEVFFRKAEVYIQ